MNELNRFGMDDCWIWIIVIFFLLSNPCCLSKITDGIKCYFGDFGCNNSIIWVIIFFLLCSGTLGFGSSPNYGC